MVTRAPGIRPPAVVDDLLFALKGEARQLREDQRALGNAISHTAAQELLANQKGFRCWNALRSHACQNATDASLGAAADVPLGAHERAVLWGVNGGIQRGAEVFVEVLAREGWSVIDELTKELKARASREGESQSASTLLLDELHQKDVLESFKVNEAGLCSSFCALSEAAAEYGKARQELEAERQRWDVLAADLRVHLKEVGRWAEELKMSQLRAVSGFPMSTRNPLLPSWVAVPLMSMASPVAYREREGVQECMATVKEVLSHDWTFPGEGPGVKVSELLEKLEKVDHQQAVWVEAERQVASMRGEWEEAEEAYAAQRRKLAKELEQLSERSQWALLCLVFPESVERAKARVA